MNPATVPLPSDANHSRFPDPLTLGRSNRLLSKIILYTREFGNPQIGNHEIGLKSINYRSGVERGLCRLAVCGRAGKSQAQVIHVWEVEVDIQLERARWARPGPRRSHTRLRFNSEQFVRAEGFNPDSDV